MRAAREFIDCWAQGCKAEGPDDQVRGGMGEARELAKRWGAGKLGSGVGGKGRGGGNSGAAGEITDCWAQGCKAKGTDDQVRGARGSDMGRLLEVQICNAILNQMSLACPWHCHASLPPPPSNCCLPQLQGPEPQMQHQSSILIPSMPPSMSCRVYQVRLVSVSDFLYPTPFHLLPPTAAKGHGSYLQRQHPSSADVPCLPLAFL